MKNEIEKIDRNFFDLKYNVGSVNFPVMAKTFTDKQFKEHGKVILSLFTNLLDSCKPDINYWFDNYHHWDNPAKDIIQIIKSKLEEK